MVQVFAICMNNLLILYKLSNVIEVYVNIRNAFYICEQQTKYRQFSPGCNLEPEALCHYLLLLKKIEAMLKIALQLSSIIGTCCWACI